MLEIACPKCGTRMPFAAELVGREVFCLGCGSHFEIPALPGAGFGTATSGFSQATEPLEPTPQSATQNPQSNGPPSRRDDG